MLHNPTYYTSYQQSAISQFTIEQHRCWLHAALLLNCDTHRARCACDDLLGTLDVDRVQILQLGLGDLAQLASRDCSGACAARRARTFLDPGSLSQQVGCRGVLVTKLKERSEYTVISTGIMVPT